MSDGIRCKGCDKPIYSGCYCSQCKTPLYWNDFEDEYTTWSDDEILDIIADNKTRI